MSDQKGYDHDTLHRKITDWPASERPRERLLARGVSGLSDAELLAILIRSGAGRLTAVDIAKQLLVEFRSLERLASRSVQELRRVKGLASTKAMSLVAAFELGRRSTVLPSAPGRICSPEDVVRRYQPLVRDLKQEEFRIILLDSANHLLADEVITTGILNSSLVHPREVFRRAIAEPAAGIILLHNHPSGNPEPSAEDIQITRQLVEASRIIGIPVHDHIILARTSFTSFAERGLL